MPKRTVEELKALIAERQKLLGLDQPRKKKAYKCKQNHPGSRCGTGSGKGFDKDQRGFYHNKPSK